MYIVAIIGITEPPILQNCVQYFLTVQFEPKSVSMENPAPAHSKHNYQKAVQVCTSREKGGRVGGGGGGRELEASVVVRSRRRTIETLSFGASVTIVSDSTVEVLPSCAQQVDCIHSSI